ncbi:MAG TPA: HEAT repeat domain-containing protein [Candidatus Hydrogenedentes bacterium]|nr:HEAT repeat domain-containing protein [Candidatus Hydrogenedentota bacterium]HOL77094.1 HEAT repeat domain-containing protein [Candidatus Hydrogenedentota bacterium]HPO87162.1 HEAT repeat domain-containing protein [Candidatus Hydrogenedentota bacterium]
MRLFKMMAVCNVLLFLGISVAASASQLDAWVAAIAGDDEAARVEARQLLPRMGGAAVPELVPLLSHEKQEVWRTAYNVIADIVSEVSAPGREKEREAVTACLMQLVAPAQSDHVKELGLRLLPLALPEGYDVQPIAALLYDSVFREKARAALELAGTRPARAALRQAVTSAEPDFLCALFNSLAALEDEDSLPLAIKYVGHTNPQVRVAAARVLAWTGSPRFLPALQEVFAAADAATQLEAGDVLLRLADHMMERGGNWETAIHVYRDVLATTSDTRLKNAALAGLGRYGDETVVNDIAAAIEKDSGRELRGAALSACRSLGSRAAHLALRAWYASAPQHVRLGLLSVFGDSKDPVFADLLVQTAASEDETERETALEALVASELPDAVDPLIAAAQRAEGEKRQNAIARLQTLGESMLHKGARAAAGRIYAAWFHLAESEEEQSFVLEKICANPTADSFDILVAHLDRSEMLKLPAETLIGLAKALNDAGRTDEGEALLRDALARLTTTESVAAAMTFLANDPDPKTWSHRLGFVTDWYVVGPFAWLPTDGFSKNYLHEPDVDVHAVYAEGEKNLSWQPYETQSVQGVVDLMSLYGMVSNKTAFGLARIKVEQETDAILCVGSDDGIKVWVNGQMVHENLVDRGSALDQDRAPIHLVPGENTVLVQVTQGGGGWNYMVRITTREGAPLLFTCVPAGEEKKE